MLSVLFGLISGRTNCMAGRDLDLPDSILINDVILSVIRINSLRLDYKIAENLLIPSLDELQVMSDDSILYSLPQPGSMMYSDLSLGFGTDRDVKKKLQDSIYVLQQLDTSIRYTLSKAIINKFKGDAPGSYTFYLPIFSSEKNLVLIQYWVSCGPLCGFCQMTVLKKKNGRWIKKDGWNCGVS
jgi:hypothetical protein